LTWQNPILLAEQLATLDLIADGRLDCDIGKGYRCNEFNGFAIDTAEADVVCEGFSKLILKAWRHEERWSHDGPKWQFNGIVVEPQCVQNRTDRLAHPRSPRIDSCLGARRRASAARPVFTAARSP